MTPYEHQQLIKSRIAASYNSTTPQLSEEELEKSANDFFEKGGKKAVIGEKRTFGGKDYIKTASGWRLIGKNRGKHKDAADLLHGNNSSSDDNIVTKTFLSNHEHATPEERARVAEKYFGDKDKDLTKVGAHHHEQLSEALYQEATKRGDKNKKVDGDQKVGQIFDRGDEVIVGKFKMHVVGYTDEGLLKVANAQGEKFILSRAKTDIVHNANKIDKKAQKQTGDVPYGSDMSDKDLNDRLKFHQQKEKEAKAAGKAYSDHSKVRSLEKEWSKRNSGKKAEFEKRLREGAAQHAEATARKENYEEREKMADKQASMSKLRSLISNHEHYKGLDENFKKDPPTDFKGKQRRVEIQNERALARKALREHAEAHKKKFNELIDTNDHTINSIVSKK